MNKKELRKRLELTPEERDEAVYDRCQEMKVDWAQLLATGDEQRIMECEDALLKAQLNKVFNSDLAWIDSDQSCKIQRLGSDEVTESTFPALYDNIRRVIPLSELEEGE